MAVGEMSPENENSTSALRGGRVAASGAASPRIRKQDSYLKAIGNNEDELSPLPRRLVQKQESYQRAILVGGVGSFSGSMNQSEDRTAQMLLIRQEAMEKSSARQGLLYRWTELSADFFWKNFNLGRGKCPPNYSLWVDFLVGH